MTASRKLGREDITVGHTDQPVRWHRTDGTPTLFAGLRMEWLSGDTGGMQFTLSAGSGVGSPYLTLAVERTGQPTVHEYVDVRDMLTRRVEAIVAGTPLDAELPAERPACPALAEGDEVLVWPNTSGRSRGRPSEPVPAKVTQAARVWLTIERTDGKGFPRQWRMRRDTQRESTGANARTYEASFVTPAQWEYDRAVRDAHQFLRSQGINLAQGSPWWEHQAQVRLARTLRQALAAEIVAEAGSDASD